MITELPVTTVTADDVQQELIAKIRGYFPDWTDTQASNNMIMLLETLSALSELEFTYTNRLARECFIQFALDPRNVMAHAQDLGYTPRFQTPSTVSAIIKSATVLTADTIIPAKSQFSSILNNVVYETTADVVIRAFQSNSTAVILEQRQSWTDTYVGTNADNQYYPLNQGPIIPATIVVTVNGVVWAYVKNFVDSLSTDNVYGWTVDNNGIATIRFGNGRTGKKPPLNAVISIAYQTGGGSAGAVPADGLTFGMSEVHDAGSNALLALSAYNALAAVPGSDAETLSQIKAHAVANLIAPAVLLTRLDVEAAANNIPGVQVASAVNWETMTGIPNNTIFVYIMPVGGGAPSPALIAAVTFFLTSTKQIVMGINAYVLAMNYSVVNFTISLTAAKGYTTSTVQNSIIQMLVNMFDPTKTVTGFNLAPGMLVALSQVSAILQTQIPGVASVTIDAPVADIQLNPTQFPVLGTVTFI